MDRLDALTTEKLLARVEEGLAHVDDQERMREIYRRPIPEGFVLYQACHSWRCRHPWHIIAVSPRDRQRLRLKPLFGCVESLRASR